MSQIRWSAAILVLLFSATLVIAKMWTLPPAVPFVPIGLAQIPRSVAGYAALPDAPTSVDDKMRAILSTASIVARSYGAPASTTDASAFPIEFVLISGTDRDALHDPRSCLTGSGWSIESDLSEPLAVGSKRIPAHFCRIVNPTLPGKPTYDMLYIYVVDGKLIESATQIRVQLLGSALIGKKNTPVYYLRFIREVNHTNNVRSDSKDDLHRFASAMWRELGLTK